MHQNVRRHWRTGWLVVVALLYLQVAAAQLGLPGLHYDEAKEAGVNAVELLAGEPVTAFRGATLNLFGLDLPLMVQDYIGALNVYLALPFLAVSGIGVPNLRALGLLAGLATLFFLERTLSTWILFCRCRAAPAQPGNRSFRPALGSLLAVTLLAVAPTFVFWSRQGIFVTNSMQPLLFLALWQAIHWMQSGQPRAFIVSLFAGALALYAKLLAGWILIPVGLILGGWWLWQRRRRPSAAPVVSLRVWLTALAGVVLALMPLLLFNVQTGGTFQALDQNIGQSYYGVDNRALLENLFTRLQQLRQILRGDQFWYLGAIYANPAAPWLAAGAIGGGLLRRDACVYWPLALLGAAVAISSITITDLFVTHYALLFPLLIGIAALGIHSLFDAARHLHSTLSRRLIYALLALAIAGWVGADLQATLNYHGALRHSGGLADHSDASYQLAYHLQTRGQHAPVILDWGIGAQVRFLSAGVVKPIEIFGYGSLQEADAGFSQRLAGFLEHPHNAYVLHAPDQTVFRGRRQLFLATSAAQGLQPVLQQTFRQRDGTPLYEIWQVEPCMPFCKIP